MLNHAHLSNKNNNTQTLKFIQMDNMNHITIISQKLPTHQMYPLAIMSGCIMYVQYGSQNAISNKKIVL